MLAQLCASRISLMSVEKTRDVRERCVRSANQRMHAPGSHAEPSDLQTP